MNYYRAFVYQLERKSVMNLNELNLSEEQLAQITKYVQSETDKVRTDYSQKLKIANEELTKYKPAEKTEAEIALEERVKVLEQREQELANKEKTLDIENKLTAKGLPKELGAYLNITDNNEDEVIGKIGEFLVNNGNIPAIHIKNSGMTKDEFKKLNYIERAKLFKENPTLYKALSR